MAESAASEIGERQAEAGKLSSGLQIAKCMVGPKIDGGLTESLRASAGANVTLSGANDPLGAGRIRFKGLTVAIMDGPNGTKEVLINTKLPPKEADAQLEEFVTLLENYNLTVTESNGRRGFELAGQRIGLPDKDVFMKGLKFKCSQDKKSVTLTNPTKAQGEILRGGAAVENPYTFDLGKIDGYAERIENAHIKFVKGKTAEVAKAPPYAHCFSEAVNSPTSAAAAAAWSPPVTEQELDKIFAPMGAAVDIGAALGRHLRLSGALPFAAPGSPDGIFENLQKRRTEILEELAKLERQWAEILAGKGEGAAARTGIAETQRLWEQNTQRLAYNESLTRCIEEISEFLKTCEESLKKPPSWSERACLEVALAAANELFNHIGKNACHFTKDGDHMPMNRLHASDGVGGSGAETGMVSDERVAELLRRIEKEKTNFEEKIRQLEEENARQADELEEHRRWDEEALRQARELWEEVQEVVSRPLPTINTYDHLRAATLDDD